MKFTAEAPRKVTRESTAKYVFSKEDMQSVATALVETDWLKDSDEYSSRANASNMGKRYRAAMEDYGLIPDGMKVRTAVRLTPEAEQAKAELEERKRNGKKNETIEIDGETVKLEEAEIAGPVNLYLTFAPLAEDGE